MMDDSPYHRQCLDECDGELPYSLGLEPDVAHQTSWLKAQVNMT